MSRPEMKKIYEKPSVEEIELYAEQSILTYSPIEEDVDLEGEEDDPL